MPGPDERPDAPSAPPSAAAPSAAAPIVITGAVDRPRRPPLPRWPRFAVAGGALVAALLLWQGAAIVAFFHPPPPVRIGDGGPTPTPPALADRASRIRAAALTACEGQQWVVCQDELDRASELDPSGDRAPDVQSARKRARAALDVMYAPDASPPR